MPLSVLIPSPRCGKVQQGREIGHEYHHKLSQDFSQAAHRNNEVNIEPKIQILIDITWREIKK